MAINLSMPRLETELKPRITVVGVGGAGGNAVNNMIRANLQGVEFVVANTDAQALELSQTERRIQLGISTTHGLGAGARPDVGRAAAEEAMNEILEHLGGSHMVFIAAGMGGGTGTGAGPVIARVAREQGILTVGVVTKPFHFEGQRRMRLADQGIEEMQQVVDTLIVIPNQNLFRVANEKTTFADAFKMADDVLYSGVRGVTDLMVMPGLINLDFADIRTVMSEMGKAMMGTGEADGDSRAIDAAQKAISNPLLDDVSMKGAKGVLINITGGPDMTLFEVDEAANKIREEVDPDANIIFGSTFDASLEGRMRVTVVATGIDAIAMAEPRPTVISLAQSRGRPMGFRTGGAATAMKVEAMAQPMVMTTAAAAPVVARAVPETPAPVVAPPVAAAPPAPAAVEAPEAAVRPAAEATATRIEPTLGVPGATAAPRAATAPAPAPKPRAPSLFERVTGTGRARQQPPAPAATAPAQAAPAPMAVAPPAYQVAPPVAAPVAPQPAPAQTRLGGLEPADRVASQSDQDDLLDIPAFLRRQAN